MGGGEDASDHQDSLISTSDPQLLNSRFYLGAVGAQIEAVPMGRSGATTGIRCILVALKNPNAPDYPQECKICTGTTIEN
jgi:hypothetical protein